ALLAERFDGRLKDGFPVRRRDVLAPFKELFLVGSGPCAAVLHRVVVCSACGIGPKVHTARIGTGDRGRQFGKVNSRLRSHRRSGLGKVIASVSDAVMYPQSLSLLPQGRQPGLSSEGEHHLPQVVQPLHPTIPTHSAIVTVAGGSLGDPPACSPASGLLRL